MRWWVLVVGVVALMGGAAVAADDPAVVKQRVADYNLGTQYLDGTGVVRDYAKALALFQKAAEAGSVDAMDFPTIGGRWVHQFNSASNSSGLW